MKILFEDNEIIVVEKEAMEPTQTSNIAAKDLVSKIKNHIHEEKNISNPYVGVVHRLDQPVSGILVFALNEKAAANLSKQVMYSDMKKYYKATVEGIMNVGDSRKLTDYMYKDAQQSKSIICGVMSKNAKLAELKFIVEEIDEEKRQSQLSIELITGRFHQIRAQLSHIGHPIVGDVKYGAAKVNGGAIALCAYKLIFNHPKTGKAMEFVLTEFLDKQ